MNALFDPGPVDENTLTDRQRVALLELRHNQHGSTSREIGLAANFHDDQHGRHYHWAERDGRQLLRALEQKRLAHYRKGLWYAITTAEWAQDDGRYDPATSDWPEGF